jgi:hypothetical protein
MRITLTGLDERVKITDLNYPNGAHTEYGILLSANTKNRNRYPSISWIYDFVNSSQGGNFAIHLCGQEAISNALKGDYRGILHQVERIQVNGKVSKEQLEQFCHIFKSKIIITQHVPYNYELLDLPLSNHALLVDASGGKGILPKGWVDPKTTKPYGFAGGLNSDNLEEQLEKIVPLSNKRTWIDLESGLRNKEDYFSILEADKCARIAAKF